MLFFSRNLIPISFLQGSFMLVLKCFLQKNCRQNGHTNCVLNKIKSYYLFLVYLLSVTVYTFSHFTESNVVHSCFMMLFLFPFPSFELIFAHFWFFCWFIVGTVNKIWIPCLQEEIHYVAINEGVVKVQR